ncbi:MAG: hypothetical protein ACYC2G_17245 [Gemmatimonadaceae bacterium]
MAAAPAAAVARGEARGGGRADGVRGGGGRGDPRRRGWGWWWAAGLAVATCISGGAPRAAAIATAATAQPGSTDHLLVITGAAGSPEYARRFETTATTLLDALGRAGLPAANLTWLAEDPARTGGRAAARSTKAEVQRALAALAARTGPGDQLLVVLVGHGSHEGPESRINLPGPDLTAADLAKALAPLRGRRLAVVNASSASGDFLPVLTARGRIVVTATKTSLERNETRFGEFFAQAYGGDGADTDKDGRVSLLEAFVFARREVGRLYERERHLLTEHALLDDDGDGRGSDEPTATAGDGQLARAFVLGARTVASSGGAAERAAGNAAGPRAAALVAERGVLERDVAALRARKADMAAAAYEAELERLLVAIAEKTQAIRALDADSVPPPPAAQPAAARSAAPTGRPPASAARRAPPGDERQP